MNNAVVVKQMWENGPFRQISTKTNKPGRYVCPKCYKPTIGVFKTPIGWLCVRCK